MLKTILLIFVVLGIIAAFIWILLHLRETGYISDDFFKQTVASVLSGALIAWVSFSFAWLLYNVQEDSKAREARMEAFIKIHNEISENRLTLGLDNKAEKPFLMLPLKTTAWDLGKGQIPIRTPQLLDGIKLLYDDIERYNWHVEFIRYKVMEKNLSPENAPEKVWEPTKNMLNGLCSKLEELEKLTLRELVILGQTKKIDYEKRFGKWENDVWVSYFIKK